MPVDGPVNTFYDYDPIKDDPYIFKFKVKKIVGNNIYFGNEDAPIVHPGYMSVFPIRPNKELRLTPMTFPVAQFYKTGANVNDINNYVQIFYNFVLSDEGEFGDGTVYTTQTTITRQEYEQTINANGKYIGGIEGDARFCLALKNFYTEEVSNIVLFNPGSPTGTSSTSLVKQILPAKDTPAKGYYGWFLSMNPVDIYLPEWNQNIGQSNVINTSYFFKNIRIFFF